MFRYLLVISLMSTAGSLVGQGWERVYDGGGFGELRDIAISPDGGYIMAGYHSLGTKARLYKADPDGYLQWTKDLPLDGPTSCEAVIATRDGGYAVAGFYTLTTPPPSPQTKKQAFLLKTDLAGNLLWLQKLSNATDAELSDLLELSDGSLVACGYRKETNNPDFGDIFVIKTTALGTQQWLIAYGSPNKEEKSYSLTSTNDGNLVIVGEKNKIPREVYALQISATDGATKWVNEFGTTNVDDVARDVVATPDGNVLLVGRSGSDGLLMKIDGKGSNAKIWDKALPKNEFFGIAKAPGGGYFVTGTNSSGISGIEDFFIGKIDEQGNVLCDKTVGRPGFDQASGIAVTSDGGAVAAGIGEFFVGAATELNPYLVKSDKNCAVFTSYISGRVFYDFIPNCLRDANEEGLEDWIVKIESPDYSRYAVAGPNGFFQILVDTGTYQIQLYPPNSAWKSCGSAISLSVPSILDTFSVDIPAQSAFDCPHNEVDVATPVLRKCADNTYTVRYCNSGTAPSVDTRVVVTLDPDLTYKNSSIAPASQLNSTYTFNVGTLLNGECGSFTLTASLACNTLTGQTHCVDAHIYPDSFCNTAGWDGSVITARAACNQNDTTVQFYLKNEGSDMSQIVQFVITEDVVMLTAPDDPENRVQLLAGQDSMVWERKATGTTLRVIAHQTPGYPGKSYPTAAIEGCGAPDSSSFHLGYYTMLPNDDAEPFKSADCQESSDTDFNPVSLKRGHPKGYDVEHYVEPQADLEFLIQFQNSGTDTVHQVVIRDTLSSFLDPATVHPGAASHPYDFDMSGDGIVQFTLPNLNLVPGSSASEGYVKFRVAQKSDIPCNTKIFNSAAIYLDFNAPVFTNQTFHTVCADSIFVQTNEIFYPGASVKVFPNPFTESATFEINGVSTATGSGYILELYDVLGRLVFNQSYSHSTFRLYRHQIPGGFLFYRLTTQKGKPVASGKLLVK